MRKQLKSLWCHGVLPLLFTRKYCIMHQSIPAAPSPPPPGLLQGIFCLISPGGEAFANFAPPGGQEFICQPRGYSRVFDTHTVSYQYKYKPPGGLYLERRINGGFFALPAWGAYIWRGLFSEFYGITTQRILLEKKKAD